MLHVPLHLQECSISASLYSLLGSTDHIEVSYVGKISIPNHTLTNSYCWLDHRESDTD
jgi:hypothetical protein